MLHPTLGWVHFNMSCLGGDDHESGQKSSVYENSANSPSIHTILAWYILARVQVKTSEYTTPGSQCADNQ